MNPGGKEKQARQASSTAGLGSGRWYIWAAIFLAAGVLGFAFWFRERILWDFRLYYAAAWLYGQGRNPFDNQLLFSIPNLDPMPFSYPLPITFLFLPLTKLVYPAAAMIWLGVISSLLCWLVLFWWRQFSGSRRGAWVPLLALLVFNLAVPKALLTGNVVTLETTLMWLALFFLAKGNLPGFVGCVVPAAAFKLSPLLFLGLPLVHPQVRRWKAVGVGGLLFAGYLAASYALAPGWFKDYRANVAFNVKEWSQVDVFNPSTYALSRRLVSILLPGLPPNLSVQVAGLLYGVMVVAVLWLSWKVARRLGERGWTEAGRPTVLYATLVYALIMPRMSDYSYILVVPAALYVAGTILRPPRSLYLAVALLLPLPFVSFRDPGSGKVEGDFFFGLWGYWSLLMVLVCWHLFSRHLVGHAEISVKRRGAPGTTDD